MIAFAIECIPVGQNAISIMRFLGFTHFKVTLGAYSTNYRPDYSFWRNKFKFPAVLSSSGGSSDIYRYLYELSKSVAKILGLY